MNKQEIFNKVATHLLTQGKKAWDQEEQQCAYFVEATGDTCAIGCLIPKKLYDSDIEGGGIECLSTEYASRYPHIAEKQNKLYRILNKAGIRNISFKLLEDLQKVHDRDEPFDWPVALITVAEKYGLHHGVVDNFVQKHC